MTFIQKYVNIYQKYIKFNRHISEKIEEPIRNWRVSNLMVGSSHLFYGEEWRDSYFGLLSGGPHHPLKSPGHDSR